VDNIRRFDSLFGNALTDPIEVKTINNSSTSGVSFVWRIWIRVVILGERQPLIRKLTELLSLYEYIFPELT
jgi:hypothetical protein